MTGAAEYIGGRQAGKTTADDDDVILVLGALEEIAWHIQSRFFALDVETTELFNLGVDTGW